MTKAEVELYGFLIAMAVFGLFAIIGEIESYLVRRYNRRKKTK